MAKDSESAKGKCFEKVGEFALEGDDNLADWGAFIGIIILILGGRTLKRVYDAKYRRGEKLPEGITLEVDTKKLMGVMRLVVFIVILISIIISIIIKGCLD